MTNRLRTILLVWLALLTICGCAATHAGGLTPQQERWWAANASQAKFVDGKGWQVPGTPGFFDASGRPLTADAGAAVTASADMKNAPALQEPAADLTQEQANWWRTNRHLARWTPPHGYVIPSVDGYFDPQGHLKPKSAVGTVAAVSYSETPGETPTPSTYDPPAGKQAGGSSSKDGTTGEMTAWDRMTGRTKHDNEADEESGWSNLWGMHKKEKSEPKAKEAMAAGDKEFREKRYAEAEPHYAEAATLWPNSPLQEDALFMRAECLFFADSYPTAFEAYETLLNKYRRSRHLEKAVAREFAIGRYWFQLNDSSPKSTLNPNVTDKTRPRLDTLGSALKAMEKVRLNDPTGPLADDSIMATANSYFLRERYPEADVNYTLLRKEYPKSEHQFQAHVLGVQAKLRSYQGPGYEGTPLKQAQDLIDQTLLQFRQVSPEERERLVDLKDKVVTARAERDWHTAKYYESRGYNEAARFHYKQMLKDYPNSQVAQAVSQRLTEIQDLPAVPKPQLTWVQALIPEPYDPKRLTLNEPAPGDTTTKR